MHDSKKCKPDLLSETDLDNRLAQIDATLVELKATVDEQGVAITDDHHLYLTLGLQNQGFPDLVLSGTFDEDLVLYLFHVVIDNWQKDGFSIGMNLQLLAREDDIDVPVLLTPLEGPLMHDGTNMGRLSEFYYAKYPEHKLKQPSIMPQHVQIVLTNRHYKLPDEPGFENHFDQIVFQDLALKMQ